MAEPDSVLIGVVDGVIGSTENVSWDVNKIGGSPAWMGKMASLLVCQMCRNVLTMVTQLYCPLEGSPYHRTIYVFTCISDECKQNSFSFRVVRAQCLAETVNQATSSQQNKQSVSQETDKQSASHDTLADWCNEADDWGDCGSNDWGDGDEADGWNDGGDVGETADQPMTSSTDEVSCDTPAIPASSGASGSADRTSETLTDELVGDIGKLSLRTDACPSANETRISLSDSMVTKPQTRTSLSSAMVTQPQTISYVDGNSGPQFVPYYINVFNEPSSPADDPLSHELQLMKEYQQREGVCLADWQDNEDYERGSRRGGSGGAEGYEKTMAKHGDRAFHKFAKKIQLCPQQCIRYSYNGSPLWMTNPTPEQTNVPRCQSCGSRRQYEFQLMPALLPYLQLQEQKGCPIEFGVVMVYTCAQSCWSSDVTDHWREEVAIVQQDPDTTAIHQAQQQLTQRATTS